MGVRGEILIILYIAAFSFLAITTTYFEAEWSRKGAENIEEDGIVRETAGDIYASAVEESTFSRTAAKAYDTYGGGVSQRVSNINNAHPMIRSRETNLRESNKEDMIGKRPLYLEKQPRQSYANKYRQEGEFTHGSRPWYVRIRTPDIIFHFILLIFIYDR